MTQYLSEHICGSLITEWPQYDESLLQNETVTIGVQVNGKRRGDITIASEESEEGALDAARAVDSISKYLEEGEVVKVIYVPGKILNIVVK